ncbi:MAG: PAS domain S-box protein [Pseudomonadota bacterium]
MRLPDKFDRLEGTGMTPSTPEQGESARFHSAQISRRLSASTAIFGLLVIALASLSLYESHVDYEHRAVIGSRNLAQALTQNLAASFDKIDVAVLSVKDELELQLARGTVDASAFGAFIARQVSRQSEIDSLRVTDDRGEIAFGMRAGSNVPTGMEGKNFFERLRNETNAGLIISKVYASEPSGKPAIAMARRINQSDGAFAGAVYAVIQLQHFNQRFSTLDVGPRGVVMLRDLALSTIVRQPPRNASGTDIDTKGTASQWAQRLRSNPVAGTYFAKGSDGFVQVRTYRKIAGYPFYVVVGLHTQDYLAEWHLEAQKTVASAAVFIIMFLLFSRVIRTSWKQREADSLRSLEISHSALRETEESLELALESAAMGSWTFVPATNYLTITAQAKLLHGVAADVHARCEDMLASVHEQDREYALAMKVAVSQSEVPTDIELRTVHPDGSIHWVSWRVRWLAGNQHHPGKLIGVGQDVTERKKAEEMMRRQNTALEENIATRTAERDRMWRMSRDILAVASLEGYYLSVNPAFTATLGWSEAEATIRPFMEFVHPEYRALIAECVESLSKGLPLVQIEARNLHKDGGERWLSWTAVPEDNLIFCVARDITAEKRQAEALRHTEAALRQAQKMDAVGQLTSGIAHDFNNLLSSIVGNLELMRIRIGQGNSADLSRYIARGLNSAERAAALTHRLLTFSRQQTLNPKPIDVNLVVSSMADLVRQTAGPAIKFATAFASDLWVTLCDRNQLENALLNLAINARDAMPDGGMLQMKTENVVVDVANESVHSALPPGSYVAVCVTDTGCGMPPDILNRAFDPFFTTKLAGRGTGLGLSMVYGFVKQSGGHVTALSEPGKGTSIWIYFPKHDGEAQADATISARAATYSRTATMLVVDDDESVRALVSEMLGMAGHIVILASDGSEGLDVLRTAAHIDLLVTDIGLPGGMNGRQLAEAARGLRPDLRVLFITGYDETAAIETEMLRSGMQIMRKPFGMDAFVSAVHRMI